MAFRFLHLLLLLTIIGGAGCGTTKQSTATEQMLGADAVDRAVAQLDFSAFVGEKIFFNSEYIKTYPGKSYQGIGYANAEYVISSLRQQMASAGCLLQDKMEDADFIIEARIGVLGQDANEIVYGIPSSNALATASAAVPTVPNLPAIPEISVARRKDQMSAVKVGAFAYHRESRRPVWQSGLALAKSTAHDSWILGAGPFESGTIHSRSGRDKRVLPASLPARQNTDQTSALAEYSEPQLFVEPSSLVTRQKPAVAKDEKPANGEKPAASTVTTSQIGGATSAAKNTP